MIGFYDILAFKGYHMPKPNIFNVHVHVYTLQIKSANKDLMLSDVHTCYVGLVSFFSFLDSSVLYYM